MKTFASLTTLLIATLITGCTFNYDEVSFEDIQKQYQYNTADSTATQHDKDTVYVSRQTGGRQNTHIPYECNLMVNAHLVIDGDITTAPPSSLKVTVQKMNIVISRDGDDDNSLNYSPELISEVTEPQNYEGWHSAPQGLDNNSRSLLKEVIPFVYDNYYDVSIKIYYVVRVKDNKLAAGCATTYERKTVTYSSNIIREKDVTIDIPIELTSVQFNASVSNYE